MIGDQLLRKRLVSTPIRSGKAMLNVGCTTLHPPKAGEPRLKFRKLAIPFLVVLGGFLQHPDPPHALPGLLRACRKRPCGRRGAENRDELATPHSITSSAVASSGAGMLRPIVFAALRLITNSNFVGSSTGRSAGFTPLRTLSA